MLVLKGILGGSQKITSENKKSFSRQKIASKDSQGMGGGLRRMSETATQGTLP